MVIWKRGRGDIEELPQEIKQRILWFLDYEEVIRVSAVSKSWRDAAATLQCLNFTGICFSQLNHLDDDNKIAYRRLKGKVRSMLVSSELFVRKLQNQDLQIKKFGFELFGELYDLMQHEIDNLLYTVLKDRESIKKFVLDVGFAFNSYYRVDSRPYLARLASIFSAHSLVKLRLRGLELSHRKSKIDLPSMKELYLRSCSVNCEFLDQLILKSPQLEILTIHYCSSLHSFKIVGSKNKLKHVLLKYNSTLKEIQIEELSNLDYICYKGKFSTVNLLQIMNCKNLKVLEMGDSGDGEKLFHPIHKLVLLSSNLNSLQVVKLSWYQNCCAKGWEKIKVSGKSIEDLRWHFNYRQVDVQEV